MKISILNLTDIDFDKAWNESFKTPKEEFVKIFVNEIKILNKEIDTLEIALSRKNFSLEKGDHCKGSNISFSFTCEDENCSLALGNLNVCLYPTEKMVQVINFFPYYGQTVESGRGQFAQLIKNLETISDLNGLSYICTRGANDTTENIFKKAGGENFIGRKDCLIDLTNLNSREKLKEYTYKKGVKSFTEQGAKSIIVSQGTTEKLTTTRIDKPQTNPRLF